jgi:hypothetical protein
MMVATIGRLGDARAEQGEKRDGGSNNGLHRLTFLATDNGREAAPMPMRRAFALTRRRAAQRAENYRVAVRVGAVRRRMTMGSA